ncbi:hypothetical protein FRC15_008031 [Serendipita sp. 397]|nr:hypothetical protein FRC15_008031 [Serendipita sp. 397]
MDGSECEIHELSFTAYDLLGTFEISIQYKPPNRTMGYDHQHCPRRSPASTLTSGFNLHSNIEAVNILLENPSIFPNLRCLSLYSSQTKWPFWKFLLGWLSARAPVVETFANTPYQLPHSI